MFVVAREEARQEERSGLREREHGKKKKPEM
jgi:hypothetical protein